MPLRLSTMSKYMRVACILARASLQEELEYSLSFWANLVLSAFWLAWACVVARAFFFHAVTVLGWSYYQLLVVLGNFFILNGIRQSIFAPNLSRLPEYVRTGSLDYLLSKPASSLFLVSVRHFNIYNFADPLLGIGLVAFALRELHRLPHLSQVGGYFLLLVDATVILYAMTVIVQSLTVWFVGTENADSLVRSVLEMGRLPIDFYKGWLRNLLTGPIPVAILTTLPAEEILGRLPAHWILVSLVVAFTLVGISFGMWHACLRSYSSASS